MAKINFELRSAIYQMLAADPVVRAALEKVVRAALEKMVEINAEMRLEERSRPDHGD